MCEGQELLQHGGEGHAFAGHLGNWLHQKFILGNGAVDLMMMDYNCSLPSLPEYARRFHTTLVSTDQAVRMDGVERLECPPESAEATAGKIIERAVAAYERRDEVNIPEVSGETVAGFTTASVLQALGGSLQPLLGEGADGSIRGIAAVAGCTTARQNQRGFNTEALTRQLIGDNILVISGGCTTPHCKTQA